MCYRTETECGPSRSNCVRISSEELAKLGCHRVFQTSSLSNGLISRFLSSTCTEVSGVENIGKCGRLSQLSWLLGAL